MSVRGEFSVAAYEEFCVAAVGRALGRLSLGVEGVDVGGRTLGEGLHLALAHLLAGPSLDRLSRLVVGAT